MYGGQRCLGSLPFTSDLITNGNFTQIGPELITNGDFSATGSELVTNGDFATDTDWVKGTGITISGGSANFTGSPNANINQDIGLITGKSYKIVFTISNYVSGDIDYNVGGNTRQGNIAANGTYTVYVVSDNTSLLYFQSDQTVGFVGSVDNVSVKELGEGWTLTDAMVAATPEGVGYYTDDGAGINAYAYQTILDVTKNYKTSFEILEFIAPTVGMSSSTTAGGFYPNAVGTFEKFLCPPDGVSPTQFKLVGNPAAAGFKMTNASVKEVGQNWTVVLSDATHYVEFPGVGARFVAGTMTPVMELQQTGIITPGKSYTVTCNVAYASGSGAIRPNVGGTNFAALLEGANTVTGVAGAGSDFDFRRDAANVDCVITNVTVTQVGGGNLERWWRMNGSQGPTAAPPAPADYITDNKAPNGIVNAITPIASPLLDQDTP